MDGMKSIQTVRKALGLTQAECAAFLGMSRSLLSMVERNQREIPSGAALRLAELEQKRSASDPAGHTPEEYKRAAHKLHLRIREVFVKIGKAQKALARLRTHYRAARFVQDASVGMPFPVSEKYHHQRSIDRCDLAAQQLLEARIGGLKAELRLLEEMVDSSETGSMKGA